MSRGMATNHFVADTITITNEVHNCIVEAFKSNRINAIWDSNPLCGVKVCGDTVEVVQYSAQHVQYNKRVLPKPQKFVGSFTIPMDMAWALVKARKGTLNYKLKITETLLSATNKEFSYTVPLYQVSKANIMEDAIELVRSLKCTNVFVVSSGKAIRKILETGIALYEPKAVMRINVHPKHNADFIVDSGSGSMLVTLPLNPSWPEKEMAFSVDMFLLRDILPVVKDWMRFNIYNNRILYFKKKHSDGSLEVRCCSLA